MKAVSGILVILVRIMFLVQLVLGISFWTGHTFNLIGAHMLLGLAIVVCLWISAIVAATARVQAVQPRQVQPWAQGARPGRALLRGAAWAPGSSRRRGASWRKALRRRRGMARQEPRPAPPGPQPRLFAPPPGPAPTATTAGLFGPNSVRLP